MICKCGYKFSFEPRPSWRKFVSYAVVRDKDYRSFLNSEIQVMKASNKAKNLPSIGEAAKLVGSLIECPQCLRLLLFRPGKEVSKNTPLFFMPELNMPATPLPVPTKNMR